MVSIRRSYDALPPIVRQPLRGVVVLGLAALVAAVSWASGAPWTARSTVVVWAVVLAVAALAAVDRHRRRVAVIAVLLGALAGWRADTAWSALEPRQTGPFAGWARVVNDPAPIGASVRVTLEIDEQRFDYWARSRAKRSRVATWRAGDQVLLAGERRPLPEARRRRAAPRHVVGTIELDYVAEVVPGTALARASNRVRALVELGSRALPRDDAALLRGLVIGDDSDQPPAMVARFRASGMSHLTAVSGQNVAFVLAAFGPLLRRLRAGPRWAATLAVIGWFVLLTRVEPSVVRAGAMAAISATAFALGRERAPARLLPLAVIVLLLIDPLLAVSVGFWLSVGATAGVAVVAPWLAARLIRLPTTIATPLAVTLGAQVGVALPALLVFGRLPVVSVPANLVAVPVAGFVMLYGLPASILAGAVPAVAPVVMLPCRIGVRWVDLVAGLGERLEPGGSATWAAWLILVGVVGAVASAGAGKNPQQHGYASGHR